MAFVIQYFHKNLSRHFGKIESAALYIVKGKVQQKLFAGRDIEWEEVKGFGSFPTSQKS